jgi:hypothetical protein
VVVWVDAEEVGGSGNQARCVVRGNRNAYVFFHKIVRESTDLGEAYGGRRMSSRTDHLDRQRSCLYVGPALVESNVYRSRIGRTFVAIAGLATTALSTAPTIFAQTTPAIASVAPGITGKAHIAGVVIDSLHRRYLSGANVVIDGINITLQTDSVGRFEIDSLPPGTYQVGVLHPVLDSLGTGIATRPFRLGPDSATYLVLTVPSAATIVRRSCGDTGDMGTSAVIGHVQDPETLQPVPNAEVSVTWMDLLVSKEV